VLNASETHDHLIFAFFFLNRGKYYASIYPKCLVSILLMYFHKESSFSTFQVMTPISYESAFIIGLTLFIF